MKFKLLNFSKIKSCLLLTVIMCSISFTQAQSLVLKGTVSGEGQPLPGVSVIVKGTNNGTVTDFNGGFEIGAKLNDVLVFSYVGFTTKEVAIKSKETLNIVLVTDMTALNEVVVVGYGTQSKKEVTGAVVNVSSDVIGKTATSDLATSLQGQVAGVNIQASSGRPGENANVQIRGLGSISSGALGPLYVVDGIPYEGNPNIAPEQIESIDILKDGAAASIYGTRASNGVILISTKKGKVGKMKVDFSTYTGIQNITSGTPLMNTVQQLYELEVKTEQLGTEPLTFFFNANALDYDSNFVKDVQNNNALIQNFNLSVSGGVENLTLNFNTNYFKQDGVLINSGFDRLSSRISGEFKKGKFKAFTSMGFSRENRTQEPWALYEYGIGQQPYSKPLFAITSIAENTYELDVDNEIYYSYLSRQLDNIDKRESNSHDLALNLEYEILKGLKYKVNLGTSSYNYFRKFFQPQYLVYGKTGDFNPTASREEALLNEDYINTKRESIENILNYNTNFGKHNVNLLAVLSYEQFDSRTVSVGVIYDKITPNEIQVLNAGAEGIKPSGYNETRTLSGKLARLQYNYDQKYLLSASIRRDGSSKFAEEFRYGNFMGYSIGWNVHEENFFKNIKSINSLKLRASWAEVGNQNIPSYSYAPIIETGINYPFGPNEELSYGSIQRRYVDPNTKWETTISKNIGIDMSFLNHKLNFTADIYQNDKEDMLLQERLPASSGTYQTRALGVYDVKVTNAGNMVNKGLELSLNFKDETAKGLKYALTGTFTKNKNEVTDLNGVERGYGNGRPIVSNGSNVDYTTFLAVGYEAGAFFLVQNDGVIKTQEELDAYKPLDASAQLGDIRYIDENEDGKIDDNDRVYAGSGQSDFDAGLSLNLEYKNFDFYVQSYYSYGAEIYNGAKLFAYSNGRHLDLYHMWSPQNPDSDIPTDQTKQLTQQRKSTF